MKATRFLLAIVLLHAAAFAAAPLQYGGKTYKTVKIGEQTWMAENLDYEAEGSRCYEDKPENCAKYGRLYNWETAMKVCPKGWHLPSNAEWDKLYRYIDGTSDTDSPYDSPTAGKHLKSKSDWNSYNGIKNLDTYEFSAHPGGYGGSDCYFSNVGYYGSWWSSTEYDADVAFYRIMFYDGDDTRWEYYYKSYFFSVRCIQD